MQCTQRLHWPRIALLGAHLQVSTPSIRTLAYLVRIREMETDMLPMIAAFPLFGIQMYQNLGYQWASSLLAFLTVAMLPFPYLFFKIGKKLRRNSKFAAT